MKFFVSALMLFAKIINKINKHYPVMYDIIIVRRDRLGDFVLWMGCAQKIRECFPEKSICLVCSRYNYEIARLSGLFTHIEVVDDNIVDYMKTFRLRCGKLIMPRRTRNIKEELIGAAITAQEKIAISNDQVHCACKIDQTKLYNQVIEVENARTPEIRINSYFCNKILSFSDDRNYYADFSSFIKKRPIDEPYFIINLGSSSATKNWPVERFSQLVTKLHKENKLCVLIGGESEISSSKKFLQLYSGRVKDMTGKTSLSEMIELIAFANFVLSNDTSTVHICAACETKCFWICWGVHYDRFSKYPIEDLLYRKNIPISIMDDYKSCFGCLLEDASNIKMECRKAIKENTIMPCIKNISVDKALSVIGDSLDYL